MKYFRSGLGNVSLSLLCELPASVNPISKVVIKEIRNNLTKEMDVVVCNKFPGVDAEFQVRWWCPLAPMAALWPRAQRLLCIL